MIAEDTMNKYFIIAFSLAVGLLAVNAWAEGSATKDECVIKCHEAAAMINSKGLNAAIEEISDSQGFFCLERFIRFLDELGWKNAGTPFSA